MITKITENIDQLVLTFPQGMGSVNCYLIKGKKGYTIIDTGWDHPTAIDTWESFLTSSNIPIEKVVVTHVHQDHIGLAKWFQETKGVPIYVSDVGQIEIKKYQSLNYDKFNDLVTMHGGPTISKLARRSSIYDFEPDGTFSDGEYVYLGDERYEAILTPGHADDHFCFYNQTNNIMIIGDHVLSNLSPVIGLWSGEESNPLDDYFQSLEKIKRYTPAISLPGHSKIIRDLQARITEIEKRHEHRLEQVYDLIKNEGKTAHQITIEVYGELAPMAYMSPFMATLTRLIYLEAKGKVHRRTISGKTQFSVNRDFQ